MTQGQVDIHYFLLTAEAAKKGQMQPLCNRANLGMIMLLLNSRSFHDRAILKSWVMTTQSQVTILPMDILCV